MTEEEGARRKRLAKRIRDARRAKGWNRQDLADALGLPVSTVEAWEAGVVKMGRPAAKRCGEALGVDLMAVAPPKRWENYREPTKVPKTAPGAGARMSARMAQLGMDAKDVARATTYHTTVVTHWQKGFVTPSWPTVQRLAEALSCDPKWIGQGDPGRAPEGVEDFMEEPDEGR